MLKQQMAPVPCIDERAGLESGRSLLAGLYLLTGQGTLGRFDAAGELAVDGQMTENLSFRLQAVLDQYRSGAVEGLTLGLVADTEPGQQGNTDTLIFSERIADGLYDAAGEAGGPASPLEGSNRSTALCQGMELLLNGHALLRGAEPVVCPVLFVPEVDGETLRERYGIEFAVNRDLYEVLDLHAPFASSRRAPDELLGMIQNMRAALRDAASPGVAEGLEGGPGVGIDPISRYCVEAALEPPHDSCFNNGDAVTGWLLESFSPFNELTDTQREIIAGYETIRKAGSGTRLIEQGSRDDICIYLLEGTLALRGPDGSRMVIKAGTRRARLPISVLSPHVYEVTAVTDVSIIAFGQALIRRIIEISTTYTGVDPRGKPEVSTAAISNGLQAQYLSRVYPSRRQRMKTG